MDAACSSGTTDSRRTAFSEVTQTFGHRTHIHTHNVSQHTERNLRTGGSKWVHVKQHGPGFGSTATTPTRTQQRRTRAANSAGDVPTCECHHHRCFQRLCPRALQHDARSFCGVPRSHTTDFVAGAWAPTTPPLPHFARTPRQVLLACEIAGAQHTRLERCGRTLIDWLLSTTRPGKIRTLDIVHAAAASVLQQGAVCRTWWRWSRSRTKPVQ